MFSSRFMLFPTFKKKIVVKKNLGGVKKTKTKFLKQFFLISIFAFYAMFNI